MTGNEYQELAMRTNDGKCTDRMLTGVLGCDMEYLRTQKILLEDESSIDIGGIINGCLGLSGEAGETLDMVKKWIFHKKELDVEHLKKEIGDVMWYVAMICESFGFELDEILQMNVDKLKARYPEGFDTVRANNRASNDV